MDSILNNDPSKLESYMDIIPIEKLTKESLSKFIDTILSICANNGRIGGVVKVIIDTLSTRAYKTSDGEVELYTRLLLDPFISIDALKVIAKSYPEITFGELMDYLIVSNTGYSSLLAANRLVEIYRPTSSMISELIDECRHIDNTYLYNFLINLTDKEEAPMPKWMILREPIPDMKDIRLPPLTSPTFDLTDIRKVLGIILDSMEYSGLVTDDKGVIRSILSFMLSNISTQDRHTILSRYITTESLKSLQDDTEIYQILGPSNPFTDSSLSQLTYGGSRMFISNEFDYDDEEESIVDWYIGRCQVCLRRIKSRFRALRLPRPHGGWIGCYCSFECMNTALTDKEEHEDRPDLITRVMIKELEKSMYRVGILERTGDFTKEQMDQIQSTVDYLEQVEYNTNMILYDINNRIREIEDIKKQMVVSEVRKI
jgi:hypothetical protein